MNEIYYQFRTNKVVRYTVIGAFLLVAFVFSGRSYFTLLAAVAGLFLGRMSYSDHVDDADL